MTYGYQFGQIYFGVPATNYTSFAVTPLGDLYRHGGWIPVLVGMFLLGCGVRFLDEVPGRIRQPAFHFPFPAAVYHAGESGGRLDRDPRWNSGDTAGLVARCLYHVPENTAAASITGDAA